MALNYSSVTKVIDNNVDRTFLPNECKFLLGEYQGSAVLINLFKILVTDALSEDDINSSNNAITNLNNLYKIVFYDENILNKLISSDQYSSWFKGNDGSDGNEPSWNPATTDKYFNGLINNCKTITSITTDGPFEPDYQFKWVIGKILGLDPDDFSESTKDNINIYPLQDVTFGTVIGTLYS